MKSISLKPYKRLTIVLIVVLAAIFILLINSQAAGQYRGADLSVPADKPAALQLLENNGASQSPKQPPGLIGKPQNHLAPPETTPPFEVPPSGQQPGEVPPDIPLPDIKPKVPYCPQYYSGTDGSDLLYPCDPCVRPLSPIDSSAPCYMP